jgi:hypothetical protein
MMPRNCWISWSTASIQDVFERIASEAGRLPAFNTMIIKSREVQMAVREVFPVDLEGKDVSKGTKVVTVFSSL